MLRSLLSALTRQAGWLAIGVVLGLITGSRAKAECTLGAVAVLPLENRGGHFVFPVEVNGHDAHFVLDTGAFALALTREAASRLGVDLSETDFTSYGIGGVQHTYRGVARRLRIGNLDADGAVLAANDMLAVSSDPGVDGLFGMNLMAAYDIDLDVAGQHAIIFEATGRCRTPTVALAPPLYDVPLVYIENNRQADVDITVGGKWVRAMLDSGAPHTVMFRSTASRFGVDLRGFSAPGRHTGHGIGPYAVAAFTHVFDVVKIGNLEFHNMPIEVIDQPVIDHRSHVGSLMADNSDGQVGGEGVLLGADFMQKVHVWISHSSQRVIMQYPPQPSVLPQ